MKILFLGGDERQVYACDYLKSCGYDSEVFLNFTLDKNMQSNLFNSEVIILPLLTSNDGLLLQNTIINIEDIFNCVSDGIIIYGGKINSSIINIANKRKINIVDYYNFDDLVINNALISAEGALYYAKEKYTGSIHKAKIAVIGFGRLGKILAFLLNSHGASVTVYARKALDLAWCGIIGFEAVDTAMLSDINYHSQLNHYDILFNTVPYQAISKDNLEKMSYGTLIIDLASAPYGVDEGIAKKYSLNYHRELSIPGRYAPKSAGEVIAKNLIIDMKKRGIII